MKHYDERLEHPKLVKVGPHAEHLDDRATLYANKNLTDGFVPTSKVRTLVDWHGIFEADAKGKPRPVDPMVLADRLVEADRWERVDGGFQIHDYLEHQQSKAQILERRAKDSERKRGKKPPRTPHGIRAESTPGPNGTPARNPSVNPRQGRKKKEEGKQQRPAAVTA